MSKTNMTNEFLERRIYSVKEVATLLCVSYTTANSLVKSKQFRIIKIGGRYKIPKKSLDKWLEGGNYNGG